MITTREKGIAIAVLVFLVLLAFAAHFWMQEHDARITAEATVKASQKVADDAASRMKELAAQDAQRATQTAAQLEAMQKMVAQVKTPQQIAQWLPQQAQVPQPITVNIPPATPADPTPPATFSVPQADLPSLRDAVEKCQECGVKLTSALSDVASRDQQLKQAGERLSATEKERDAYKVAAKGTFWKRASTAGKYISLGVGIAVAVTCGSGHCK